MSKAKSKLPGWAYPTNEALKMHYFKAEGAVSPCRKYSATAISLFWFPETFEPIEVRCCKTCWKAVNSEPHDSGPTDG